MALENPTFISDLVATNPEPTDKRRDGDDHIRNIKKAIKATFPNVAGALTPSHTELNYLDGVTNNVQDQLDSKLEAGNLPDLAPYALRDSVNSWGAVQSQGIVSLGNVQGVVTLDLTTGTTFILDLIGNITSLNISGAQAGQEITLKVRQAGSGNYTITFSSSFHFPNAIAPTLSTAVNAYDILAGKIIDNIAVMGFLRGLGSV